MEDAAIYQKKVTPRHGTFSSSNIWKLMTNDKSGKDFGVKGKTYIKQVFHELNLGRSINPERDSRPTSWGKFVETRAFDLLGLEYRLVSDERLVHPEYDFWTGAPDLLKREDTVCDVKCPVSLEVFCDKIAALKNIDTYRNEFPEDYWQLVSNAILSGRKFAEAVIYVPYLHELKEIREAASNYSGNQNKIAWIGWAEDEELPYVIEGGKYKNLNIVRFEVSEEDKEALTKRVKLAGSIIRPQLQAAA